MCVVVITTHTPIPALPSPWYIHHNPFGEDGIDHTHNHTPFLFAAVTTEVESLEQLTIWASCADWREEKEEGERRRGRGREKENEMTEYMYVVLMSILRHG